MNEKIFQMSLTLKRRHPCEKFAVFLEGGNICSYLPRNYYIQVRINWHLMKI
jgi:hypothetical protein